MNPVAVRLTLLIFPICHPLSTPVHHTKSSQFGFESMKSQSNKITQQHTSIRRRTFRPFMRNEISPKLLVISSIPLLIVYKIFPFMNRLCNACMCCIYIHVYIYLYRYFCSYIYMYICTFFYLYILPGVH